MSEDGNASRSGRAGFGDVTHETAIEERSTAALVAGRIKDRWQTVLAIVTLALATLGLWYMDGGLSTDVWVFGTLAALLAVYFLLTLRTDVKLE